MAWSIVKNSTQRVLVRASDRRPDTTPRGFQRVVGSGTKGVQLVTQLLRPCRSGIQVPDVCIAPGSESRAVTDPIV
jgi:hypothetical protein